MSRKYKKIPCADNDCTNLVYKNTVYKYGKRIKAATGLCRKCYLKSNKHKKSVRESRQFPDEETWKGFFIGLQSKYGWDMEDLYTLTRTTESLTKQEINNLNCIRIAYKKKYQPKNYALYKVIMVCFPEYPWLIFRFGFYGLPKWPICIQQLIEKTHSFHNMTSHENWYSDEYSNTREWYSGHNSNLMEGKSIKDLIQEYLLDIDYTPSNKGQGGFSIDATYHAIIKSLYPSSIVKEIKIYYDNQRQENNEPPIIWQNYRLLKTHTKGYREKSTYRRHCTSTSLTWEDAELWWRNIQTHQQAIKYLYDKATRTGEGIRHNQLKNVNSYFNIDCPEKLTLKLMYSINDEWLGRTQGLTFAKQFNLTSPEFLKQLEPQIELWRFNTLTKYTLSKLWEDDVYSREYLLRVCDFYAGLNRNDLSSLQLITTELLSNHSGMSWYNYLKKKYKNNNNKVMHIICYEIMRLFPEENFVIEDFCQAKMNRTERYVLRLLWRLFGHNDVLWQYKLNTQWEREYESIEGILKTRKHSHMTMDFYIPSLHLCLEVDGGQHHGIKGWNTIKNKKFSRQEKELLFEKQQELDIEKSGACYDEGFNLARLPLTKHDPILSKWNRKIIMKTKPSQGKSLIAILETQKNRDGTNIVIPQEIKDNLQESD